MPSVSNHRHSHRRNRSHSFFTLPSKKTVAKIGIALVAITATVLSAGIAIGIAVVAIGTACYLAKKLRAANKRRLRQHRREATLPVDDFLHISNTIAESQRRDVRKGAYTPTMSALGVEYDAPLHRPEPVETTAEFATNTLTAEICNNKTLQLSAIATSPQIIKDPPLQVEAVLLPNDDDESQISHDAEAGLSSCSASFHKTSISSGISTQRPQVAALAG